MDISLLKKLGFSDKSATVYMTLLRLGPASVRQLAEESGLNRGSVYDVLKWLQEQGLVNFYHQDTRQYFVAEEPSRLEQLLERRSGELQQLQQQLQKFVPELASLYDREGKRPVARYYQGRVGLRGILEDVLQTVTSLPDKIYRIYSAVRIREFLYEGFPDFSEQRVKRDIRVRVIAMGEGGILRGLDERKWISTADESHTYIIIYAGKTAYISLDAARQPIGVVIDNEGVAQTQKIIFDHLWKNL